MVNLPYCLLLFLSENFISQTPACRIDQAIVIVVWDFPRKTGSLSVNKHM